MRTFSALRALLILTLNVTGGTSDGIVSQPEPFRAVKLGDSVSLRCYTVIQTAPAWYKQNTNRKLQQVIFDDRVSVASSTNEYSLHIRDVSWEHAGTYYCGVMLGETVHFGPGTVVVIEGDSRPLQSVLQSPDFIRAQPGDSVTLSCSVTSSRCPQNHTGLMWVRSGSASSEVVPLSQKNTTVTCEKRDDEELKCVHNLTLDSAEEGTYLCVVNICGDTQTGPGTRIQRNVQRSPIEMALIVVSAAYGVTVFVLVGIICKIYKKTKGTDLHSHGDHQQHMKVDDSMTYARVKVNARSSPRQSPKINNPNSVVYTKVRTHQTE